MGKLALARDSQPAKIVLPNFGRSHSDETTRFDCFPKPGGIPRDLKPQKTTPAASREPA
jgi:hypothetical protein